MDPLLFLDFYFLIFMFYDRNNFVREGQLILIISNNADQK